MVEVVAHVVAGEGQHRERVAADHALLAERSGGGLRAHRRGHVDAVGPVERLVRPAAWCPSGGHRRRRR